MQHYKIYGNTPVKVVIEMGLGATIKEWEQFALCVSKEYGVLVYERYGVNHSATITSRRTPQNIAAELLELLSSIPHEEKLIVVAHSQGGLYASEFCAKNQEMIDRLILVDPLSPTDNRFRAELSEEEYKKSGAGKRSNFTYMLLLTKIGLGFLVKKMMRKAPPFYYADFSFDQTKDILDSYVNKNHLKTCLKEYAEAHNSEVIASLVPKAEYPDIPITLITHASEPAILENMEFGNNTREFAQQIETLWQDIMKEYLQYSTNSQWIQAKRSTHYIHLLEPEIILDCIMNK